MYLDRPYHGDTIHILNHLSSVGSSDCIQTIGTYRNFWHLLMTSTTQYYWKGGIQWLFTMLSKHILLSCAHVWCRSYMWCHKGWVMSQCLCCMATPNYTQIYTMLRPTSLFYIITNSSTQSASQLYYWKFANNYQWNFEYYCIIIDDDHALERSDLTQYAFVGGVCKIKCYLFFYFRYPLLYDLINNEQSLANEWIERQWQWWSLDLSPCKSVCWYHQYLYDQITASLAQAPGLLVNGSGR